MSKFPPRAYRRPEFMNSRDARNIRILCEYQEAEQRFRDMNVENTIVFFGSARTLPRDVANKQLQEATKASAAAPKDAAIANALKKAKHDHTMSAYYEDARALAHRLTDWSNARADGHRFYITSGGGPGIMEAANRGAAEADPTSSVGLGISLPFEQGINDYVTDELAFEFHYFFTRKYWFLYLCKALVIFPGGFGTLDELFETLTLIQSKKIKRDLPLVLYGKAFWDRVMNLDALAELGTISPEDLDLIHTSNSVDDAFDYLTAHLEGEPTKPEGL